MKILLNLYVLFYPKCKYLSILKMMPKMSFMTEDESVYLKYSEIWNKIKKLLGVKFSTHPIRNENYITTKVKVFNGVNKTTFTNDEIHKEKNHYVCITATNIDPVMKIVKRVYPKFI